MLSKLLYYPKFAFSFCVLRRDVPFILGLVLCDRCNLACRHCRVANTGRRDLTMDEVRERLIRFHRRGCRALYLEGGEPFLWRNGDYALDDVVEEARRIGYFHVHVFTNGMFPLESRADMLWVSLDGPREMHALLRGDHLPTVVANMRASGHPRMAIVYTINSLNKGGIREFLTYVQQERLPALGVVFYFHTPYYGKDDLFIKVGERFRIVDNLIRCKREGFPVLNSYAGLQAFRTGRWKRRFASVWVSDVEGDYMCCRANSGWLCEDCGYAFCAEITESQRLRPSAVLGLLRYR
jgi:MoaA/NifB/PqqE/SkfB family radical SAM enzyme